MKAFYYAVVSSAILLGKPVEMDAAEPLTVTRNEWSITADPDQNTISISHSRLGLLLTNIELSIPGVQGGKPLKISKVDKSEGRRLFVRTTEFKSAWIFEPGSSGLRFSCTSPSAILTAQVPVSDGRVVARLLDPEGLPVEWTGTGEVAGGYGGSMTRNSSRLPRQNPDCMYFALGSVSGGMLHSLFDRVTDTAIEFPSQANLIGSRDQTLLKLIVPFSGSAEIRLTQDYFTSTLGVPFYSRFREDAFPRPPMVWCSWTSYYSDVNETAVVKNADWLAENLKPYGFQYVQIDDGYDRGLDEGHYWVEHWDTNKFPHGPQWLAKYIKSKGLHSGLWLVPNAYAGLVQTHPEWYLVDKQGGIIRDYGTPALDSSNPEVLKFLKGLFTTLRNWGFEYYKFDGEHALPKYVPAVNLGKLYDSVTDPIRVYRNRLDVIRDVIGPEAFVEGCPAGTPLNGIGFFNSCFNGQDVYNNWNGMHALFSSINANAFLNRMVVYVMPGEGMELGERLTVEQARQRRPAEVVSTARTREDPMIGFGVTTAEARTLVSLVALSGVAYPLAGVMPELPADRLPLLQLTLPTMPIRPIDLFSRGNDIDWDTFKHTTSDDYIQHYPEVVDVKVNASAGVYDILALPNWRSQAVTKKVSFSGKLGLPGDCRCVAFDFWNQKLLGVFQDSIAAEIEGHDTRVILLHPCLNHPQLIGNSRHISGSFSIRDLVWDDITQVLKGGSEPVTGRPYTLFVHVPKGAVLVKAQAATERGHDIPVHSQQTGDLLNVSFNGTSEVVRWQMKFKASP